MRTHNRCSVALCPLLWVTGLQNGEPEMACIESRGSPATVPEEELLPETLTLAWHHAAGQCYARHDSPSCRRVSVLSPHPTPVSLGRADPWAQWFLDFQVQFILGPRPAPGRAVPGLSWLARYSCPWTSLVTGNASL